MILDKELLLSDEQDAKASGSKVSTNTIDLGTTGRDIGAGEQLYAVVVIDAYTAGTNTSVTISVITSANEDLSSATTIISTPAIAAVDISAGRVPIVLPIPPNVITQRYLGLNYACATVATALTVTAFIAKDLQSNL